MRLTTHDEEGKEGNLFCQSKSGTQDVGPRPVCPSNIGQIQEKNNSKLNLVEMYNDK